MAYVPNILQPGYAPAWQPRRADRQEKFQTTDGTEYILYVPSSNQFDAYEKSQKKYKTMFNQLKEDIKNNAAIAKNRDNLPKDFDHVEWADLLSATFKKLNETWGINDKIWIRNKHDDGTKNQPVVLAITPVKTQRNAKRGRTEKVRAATSAEDGDESIIDASEITWGPELPPITQNVYTITRDGMTYYYHREADADNNNYFKVEKAVKAAGDDDEDDHTEYESDNERDH